MAPARFAAFMGLALAVGSRGAAVAGSVRRPMGRRLAVTGLVVALGALAAAPAASAGLGSSVPRGSTYLALGDSVSFGYQEPTVVPAPDYTDQSSFVGWPEHAGDALGLKVTNASCPGETSASFRNVNAQSNGCENALGAPHTGYRTRYPLHVKYSGSQLAFAISFLRKNPKTRLVTLMIGANDLFLCQKLTPSACTATADQQKLFAFVANNVKVIVADLRKTRYTGRIVIMRYYSLNYGSSVITNAVRGLNAAVYNAAKPYKVSVADGYGQFHAGSIKSKNNPCTAGLLTQLSTGGCGVHPTWAGQSLLALALAQKLNA